MTAVICEQCTDPICPTCSPDATRCPADGTWHCGDCGPCRCRACAAAHAEDHAADVAEDVRLTGGGR